jgi:hypothetical protein
MFLTVAGVGSEANRTGLRRMTAVRLTGGRAAIFGPIALDDTAMARVEALGRPAMLIVRSAAHVQEARVWTERYPDSLVLTPPGLRDVVGDVVPIDATTDILNDPDVRFVVLPGTGERECALTITRGGATTLVVNGIISRARHPQADAGPTRAQPRVVSGLAIPRSARQTIQEPRVLADQLRAWSRLPDLRRIVVGDGEAITVAPDAALARLADYLTG